MPRGPGRYRQSERGRNLIKPLTPDSTPYDAEASVRTRKAITRAIGAGSSLRDVAKLSAEEWRGIKNCGQCTVLEIRGILAQAGLALREESLAPIDLALHEKLFSSATANAKLIATCKFAIDAILNGDPIAAVVQLRKAVKECS